MIKLIFKIAFYSLILFIFESLNVLNEVGVLTIIGFACVLTLVNTFVRPITNLVALPINIFTFGIASVFSNLLCLVIANAVFGKIIEGFWIMLLFAFVVMMTDDLVRQFRLSMKKNSVEA